MRPLYLLSDIVDFPASEEHGQTYAVVGNNFDLGGTIVDLAFENTEKPFINEDFYTIPLVFMDFDRDESGDIASKCEEMHELDTRFTRYFVSTSNPGAPILVEASGGSKTNFPDYFSFRLDDLDCRIDSFNRDLEDLSKNYQAAVEAYP